MGMFNNRRGDNIDDVKYSIYDCRDMGMLSVDTIYNMIGRSIQDSIFTEDVYYYAINKVLNNTTLLNSLCEEYERKTKKSCVDDGDKANPDVEDYTDEFIKWISNYAMDIVDRKSSDNSYQILSDVAYALVSQNECDDIARYFYQHGKDSTNISKRDVMNYIHNEFGISNSDIEKIAEKCIDNYLAYAR